MFFARLPGWERKRQDGQRDRRQGGLDMNTLCLPLNLGQFERIHNLFWLFTELARASRRKTRSGVIAPLEEAFG